MSFGQECSLQEMESRTMKTLGIIDTVGPEPSRDTDATRLVGGESLIARVARRVSDADWLDGVAVIVPTAWTRDLQRCVPSDATVVSSDAVDAMARLVAAAEQQQAEAVVRVDLHCPFVDPDLLDGLVAAAQKQPGADYIGYRGSRQDFRSLSQVGLCGEWCLVSALKRALKQSREAGVPRSLPDFLLAHPDIYQLRFIPVPQELERHDLQLRLDKPQDWAAAEELIEALGPESLSWHGITSLLDGNPSRRNAGSSI
jgi:spore coat polysaccharide biosynthesis protein SpsF (cytidylyltransferase family)